MPRSMICNKKKLQESVDKLMKIHAAIEKSEMKDAKRSLGKVYDSEAEAREKMMAVYQHDTITREVFYDRRSKIIETIPYFWLTAFLGHYALGLLLTEEDQKIFEFLNSVTVEDTPSGYTITFNFAQNQYFTNERLTKKLSYSNTGVEICGCTINWKDAQKQGYTDADTSFLAWFSGRDDDLKGMADDEVAKLIIDDLWPNAIKYFVNGNFTDEEENAIDEDCKLLLSYIEE